MTSDLKNPGVQVNKNGAQMPWRDATNGGVLYPAPIAKVKKWFS